MLKSNFYCSPMTRSSRRRLLAFTLIELLVVIAIIAVLAAILVPVGQNMIKSGRSAQATSNLKQIGALYGSYVADAGRLPPHMLRTLGMPGKQYPFFQNALRMQAGLPEREGDAFLPASAFLGLFRSESRCVNPRSSLILPDSGRLEGSWSGDRPASDTCQQSVEEGAGLQFDGPRQIKVRQLLGS